MCGIAGIWHTHGLPVNPAQLKQITDRLRHRGPDDEGYLLAATASATVTLFGGIDSDRALGLAPIAQAAPFGDLAFGFRRLAIVDLSPAGHQPMASADQRYWIVFNGEIYNYRALRDELTARGHRFRSGSDTEVILAAYAEWGEGCLTRFNGMFAFAIYDRAARRLLIARDHVGIKPLYYTWDGQTLRFASEIKALVGPQGIPFVPNEDAIYRFLLAGLLPSPRGGTTFFEGVSALPAGQLLVIEHGQLRASRWWSLAPAAAEPLAATAAAQAFGELFQDAVRLQLNADRPVGTCLSGGLDSSSIVCTANQLLGMRDGRQKTFSAVYATEGRYNERPYIETVVRATGVDANYVYPDAAGLLADARRLVWFQDEPFQSTSIFAQWCVMRAVRKRGVIVLLDGQGADETLAGYRPFAQFLGDQLRRAKFGAFLQDAALIQARTGMDARMLIYQAAALQAPGALIAARRRLRRHSTPISAIQPAVVQRQGGQTADDWWDWERHRTLDATLREQVTEISLPHLLRYEDRNSMAWGVEARVPFLDPRLIELAFGAAGQWRIHRGWTKWPLRQAMQGVLPDSIAWRSGKVGFETPESDWMPQLLAAQPELFADHALSAAYLDLSAVRSQIAAGTATTGDAWRLWRWVNLELWLQIWSDGGQHN